jgi:N-acetylneuraminic acid mutarotase
MKNLAIAIPFMIGMNLLNAQAQSIWLQMESLTEARQGAVSFSIGSFGYIGTGADTIEKKKDLWRYDPSINAWSQKADLPGASREYGVGFSINNYGYVGTGDPASGDNLDDFWQYDPVSNTWTQKADFPGGKRWFATGFGLGDKGYLGTGYNDGFQIRKDFYEYDPATDTWTAIADCSGKGRIGATGFSIGDKGYVCFGGVSSGTGIAKDLWEYDPSTGVWTKKADLPGSERAGAVGFSIAGKGYIGTGEFGNTSLSDFWEYDPLSDEWAQLEDFAGGERRYAAGFSIGDKGYVGTGWAINGDYLNDFWEFTPPGCAVPGNLATTNISPASAKLKWDGASGAEKYKVLYKADSVGAAWISKTVKASNTMLTITGLIPNTSYKWKVKTICEDANSAYSATQTFSTTLRMGEDLSEIVFILVSPNPFHGSTTLSFSLMENSHITLLLFDLAGRKIQTVLDGILEPGIHETELNGEMLSEGIYFLKATMNNQTSVIKLIVE